MVLESPTQKQYFKNQNAKFGMSSAMKHDCEFEVGEAMFILKGISISHQKTLRRA